MRAGESAIYGDRLAVDVRCFIRGEKKRHGRDFVRISIALQRIELSNAVFASALARIIEYRLGHAGLDQTWTDRIDANASAHEEVCSSLYQRDHAGLACTVRRTARA